MRNECNIIRDILPLYREDMVSADTVSFVEEHLNDCEECRTELENMKQSTETADISEPAYDVNEATPLKAVKKRLRRKQMLTILLSSVVAAVLVVSAVTVLFLVGVPTASENIKLETEFQYSDEAYLNQLFALHMIQVNGQPLYVTVKERYEADENGENILVGYELTPREVVNLGQHSARYTIGYSYREEMAPDEDFDFTFTIKFKDKTVVYSMVEEGLFVPQDDVVRYF